VVNLDIKMVNKGKRVNQKKGSTREKTRRIKELMGKEGTKVERGKRRVSAQFRAAYVGKKREGGQQGELPSSKSERKKMGEPDEGEASEIKLDGKSQ